MLDRPTVAMRNGLPNSTAADPHTVDVVRTGKKKALFSF